MKRNLLIALILAMSLPLLANPVDETTAKQLAQNFWKENNIMGVRGDKVFKKRMDDARFVNVAPQCGYSEFYIFNNEDGKGFVIIAADDCVTPILGYSYDNNFAAENLPPNLKGWLDGYAEQIRMAVEMKAIATEEILADWECLRQGKNLPIKSERAVSPLLGNNEWGQGCYYNNLCPNDPYGDCYHALTGCTGTAMAQIMHYWEYPEIGMSSTTYTPDGYPTQSVNFGESVYDWDNMPNKLDWATPEIQVNAVAKLLWHCGVSLHAAYGPGNTSASPINVPNALQSYFKYSNDCYGEWKENNTVWLNKVKQCLNNARPIHYSAWQSTTIGHSFVCDGYDQNNYLHFNWGWNGNDNGYFSLTALNAGGYQFNLNHYAVFDIHPNYSNFNLVYHSNVQMSNTDYWFYDDISAYTEILNNGNLEFNGYIGAGVFMETVNDYIFLGIMDQWDCTGDPLPSGFYIYGNLEDTGGPPYIPGSYMIIMLYSFDGYYWDFIDNGSYYDGYFDISYSSSIETRSEFTILTGDGNCLYQNTDATINVDVKNAGNETFYGQFNISLLDYWGNTMQTIDIFDCTNGLQPNYHYTNGLDFTGLITVEPGTYLMSLAYKESGSSNWYYAGASDYQNPVWVYVAPEPVYADPYEPNNSQNLAYSFTPNFSGNTATVNTTDSNLHNSSDVDYYKINLNSGYDYTITPRVHDAFNSGNGNTYSVDAMFAYSTDGVNWSEFYDDVMTGNFSVTDGGTVYFDVISYFEGNIGTYLLSIDITRTQHTNSYTISVSASPSNGGSVTGGGTYNQGQSCTVHATANSGYTFVNWTENGTQVSTNANYTFTVTGNRNLVANFQAQPQQYTISVSASPNNGGNVTGGGTYQQGQTCTVSATANSGYTFVNWTENGTQVSTNPNYTFTVTNSRNLVAHFTTQGYVITAIADPTNGGLVTGSGGYNYGETCTLTATPNTGYTFQRWTKNGTQVSSNPTYSFTVIESATYTAHFNAQNYTVTVAANPNNAGSVSGGGSYTYGQTCTVTASANNGYAFTNWTENGSQVSTNASYSFTVTGNRNLVANFAQNTHTIHATAGANGIITPSGTITVAHGANQSFSMIPDSDYEIQDVYIDGNPVGPMTSYTFTNVTTDHYIHVTFTNLVGIKENNNFATVIYPNPTTGIVNIKCNEAAQINVFNAFGQLLLTQSTNGNDQETIDISNLPNGLYLVQMIGENGIATKQIIKIQ